MHKKRREQTIEQFGRTVKIWDVNRTSLTGKLLLNIMEFQIVMVYNLDTDESIIGNEQFIFEKKPEWHRMLVCGICYDQEKTVFKINISQN